MEIILASQSPRRQELLKKLDLPFRVRISPIDEEIYRGEDPRLYVLRMAETKAAVVAEKEEKALVIGADTIVLLDGQILGKPKDQDDAAKILEKIQGRKHLVLTGVSLNKRNNEKTISFVEETEVDFAPMTRAEIQTYIATGQPLDKAGAYGIQDRGALFVRGISGSYYNVMGLPLRRIYEEINILIEGEVIEEKDHEGLSS